MTLDEVIPGICSTQTQSRYASFPGVEIKTLLEVCVQTKGGDTGSA